MILVNEPRGYRICLECRDTFDTGDERAWMTRHTACEVERPPTAA